MTFDQIWEQLTRKQPKLEREDAVVEFAPGDLRRLLKQAYEQGEASVSRETQSRRDPLNPFTDFFS